MVTSPACFGEDIDSEFKKKGNNHAQKLRNRHMPTKRSRGMQPLEGLEIQNLEEAWRQKMNYTIG